MLLPLSLLFVGAVLTLNGLWMMNRISEGEIVFINLATAFITGAVALLVMSVADTSAAVKTAALTLLFSITYLWVGVNRLTGWDGRGLGWFSIGLGLVELLAPGRVTRTLGMQGSEGLVRAAGLRELGHGVLSLSTERRLGLWSRVAGDALDVVMLMPALSPSTVVVSATGRGASFRPSTSTVTSASADPPWPSSMR